MRRIKYIFWIILVTIVFLSAENVLAQSFKATLTGQVIDANGAAVPSASVTITENATNQNQNVTTGESGDYTFTQLDPGTYTLRVEAANFKALVQTDLVLETNQTSRIN